MSFSTNGNSSQQPVFDLVRNAAQGPFDVIVIGSGMGGMSCAAALSKSGKRVLVLEQHYIPGGFTHMFSRKGYSWDVGVHAIGEMHPKAMPAKMLSWLTDGKIQMNSLGDPYDRFSFPDNFNIAFPDSYERFKALLKERFPQDHKAIDEYLELVKKAVVSTRPYFGGKSLPQWLDRITSGVTGIMNEDWWGQTTQQVLDRLTSNEKLKAVLTAQWGYYGATPAQSSFALHALTVRHFWNGAYYPVGGSKSFADTMLGVVKEAGGQTLVRASVDKILIEDGKAVGVKLDTGEEFRAPIIVSAAGARVTFENLLPPEVSQKPWTEDVKKLGDSPSYVCLNLGFKGDIRAKGAATSNFWFMETWDMNRSLWDVNDPNAIAPILYVSFPSLKDPLHDPGPEQMHTGECITFVPWDAFEKWKHTRRGKREKTYQEYKKAIQERMLAQLRKHLPDVLELLDYVEMSTPLSTLFFTRAPRGAIYGIESSTTRYKTRELRTRTPIKGLYLSGSDITTLGIAGAMSSGILTAATIDKKVYSRLV